MVKIDISSGPLPNGKKWLKLVNMALGIDISNSFY